MKTDPVLVDTGPLIALFRERDEHHVACREQFGQLGKGLPTSWPVLTEAFYILRKEREAVGRLVEFLEEGLLVVGALPEAEFAAWLREFFERYSDREPQLADASLVYLAEREGIERVFTLDRRDFSVYRASDGRALRVIPGPR